MLVTSVYLRVCMAVAPAGCVAGLLAIGRSDRASGLIMQWVCRGGGEWELWRVGGVGGVTIRKLFGVLVLGVVLGVGVRQGVLMMCWHVSVWG